MTFNQILPNLGGMACAILIRHAQFFACRGHVTHIILHDVGDVPATRKKLGMPDQYGACHTAKVGQYLVEGHVPAADIKRLLKKHPKAIGLAVPSMPPGAPGMQGDSSIPYDTLLVSTDGTAKTSTHHQ